MRESRRQTGEYLAVLENDRGKFLPRVTLSSGVLCRAGRLTDSALFASDRGLRRALVTSKVGHLPWCQHLKIRVGDGIQDNTGLLQIYTVHSERQNEA